jgi:anti-sigma regulatory factor (Ser/Thr protein kinase)
MRSGLAAAFEGIFHETSIYASDAELLDTAHPFLSDGLDEHEPTYVILGPRGESLVRQEFGEPDGLRYISAHDAYVRPATTVKSYRDACAAEVAAGAEQIRFITEVPHPGNGSAWDWWGRYESAVNEIFADLPVWAICTYDERTTPTAVLDEVLRSHPYVAGPGGEHAANVEYETPTAFLTQRSCAYTDPLEAVEPLIALTDPGLVEARRTALAVARERLGPETADNLAVAVSEVVANAQRHGCSPVELRVWASPERVVATIKDRGAGIQDATIGLAPVEFGQSGGRGLWIANQLCDHLSISRLADGFEVKLVVGTPSIAS